MLKYRKLAFLLILIIQCIYAQKLPHPVLKQGFPKKLTSGPYSNWGHVIPYDFDIDGKKEILLSTGYWIEILRYDGSNFPGWPKNVNIPVYAGMAVGDVDADGKKEIVGVGFTPGGRTGALYVWKTDGDNLQGFPKILQIKSFFGITSGPVLCDIDNDNKLEIIIGNGNELYMYDYRGEIVTGWPQIVKDMRFGAPPIVGDLDGDENIDIITGASYDSYDSVEAVKVFCYEKNGEVKNGWPYYYEGNYLSCDKFGAIGTLTRDYKKGVIFGTGYSSTQYNSNFFLLNSRGEIQPGWPRATFDFTNISYGISLAELNLDYPLNEIVTGDMFGMLYGWDNKGQDLPGWPYWLPLSFGPSEVSTTPMIYVNLETFEYTVFTGTNRGKYDPVDSVVRGYIFATRNDSTQESWSPLRPIGIVENTPIFTDLENDGTTELIVYTWYSGAFVNEKYLYVWEFPGIPFDKEHFPWPLPLYNRWNTGEFGFEPTDTIVVAVRDDKSQALETKLYQNYPNPFNTSTRIKYELDRNTSVKLSIYNVLGQLITTIVDAYQKQGRYEAVWDARKYPSGVYYVKLETDTNILMSKVLYVK